MSEECGNCRFFARLEIGKPVGTCRRLPPVTHLIGQTKHHITGQPVPFADSFRPRVADIDWCGEHQTRPTVQLREINLNVAELQGNG